MRVLRILLQIIFVLISLITIFLSKPVDGGTLVMLAIFVLIILILGPCWPSQENIERWGARSKWHFPTDDPKVAIYVANYLVAGFGFYRAWVIYAHPTEKLWSKEYAVFAIGGINGVIAFWIFLAFAALAWGIAAQRKARFPVIWFNSVPRFTTDALSQVETWWKARRQRP